MDGRMAWVASATTQEAMPAMLAMLAMPALCNSRPVQAAPSKCQPPALPGQRGAQQLQECFARLLL